MERLKWFILLTVLNCIGTAITIVNLISLNMKWFAIIGITTLLLSVHTIRYLKNEE
jgi:hypothetical protein